MNPQISFLINNAIPCLQSGNLESAELYLRQALRVDGKNAEVLRLLAVALSMKGMHEEALEYIRKASSLNTRSAVIYSNMGNILLGLKRYEEALAAYDKAIQLAPAEAELYSNYGNALQELRRYDEALNCYQKAIALAPNHPELHSNYGNALQELRRYDEALNCYQKAIALAPNYSIVWNSIGNAFRGLQRYQEAAVAYERALEIDPQYIQALLNRGLIFTQYKNYEDAIACYDRALQIHSGYAEAWLNKGIIFKEQGLHVDAIACYDQAIHSHSEYAMAWYNKGLSYEELGLNQEAISCYEMALKINPDYPFLKGKRMHLKMMNASWSDYFETLCELNQGVQNRQKIVEPFGYQGIADSEENLLISASLYAQEFYPVHVMKFQHSMAARKKIRIGYLCGEFRNQATSVLMVELFELHDKNKFEIYAFDNGWDDDSDIRQRINLAFDEVIDISKMGDLEAAQYINEMNIDILVNLNGYFGRARQGVFALKPAPIQVNYLGFPGTLGAEYFDYIIADKTVIPESSACFYLEKIAYLPNSYQVNDSKRVVASTGGTRSDFGLPEEAFVFCCFNNIYKITPTTFDIWMRILVRVPHSVLWLLGGSEISRLNLCDEAERRGVSRSRIIFCERIGLPQHLARHRLADLFLDTLPYNAHTTASDALWAGLPVLTQVGKTFPGRVSASLLQGLSLPELITQSDNEFEDLAVAYANDSERLNKIRNKLNVSRLTEPLFNAELFSRSIEKAYIQMFERCFSGLPPTQITVD